ncbi:MAG TPA: MarR family transcriptional regulator [Methanomassiliicoccales archaeon]|nr:MarR family transcriptional regulator [Methanomassiliicoccales archaeon]
MPFLPLRDRAILHFYGERRAALKGKPSEASTQEGIASALGVNRTHVTRTLKPLVEDGLLQRQKGHVEGKERRLIHYELTPLGLERAKAIIAGIQSETVEVIEPAGSRQTRIAELLEDRPDLDVLAVADAIGGSIKLLPAKRVVVANSPPTLELFLDRREEVAEAESFASGKANLLAVYANYGYGSTTFLKHVALRIWKSHLLWHDLEKDPTPKGLNDAIRSFADQLGLQGDVKRLTDEEALICIDGYHDVSQEMVDVLFELNLGLRGGRAKMAVAMREETPSYNRFFGREDVDAGNAVEVRLHRMDDETSRELMGDVIDDEAFKVLQMLTKGQPLAIVLVRNGDEEGLRKIRQSEEARFMMHLRSRVLKT